MEHYWENISISITHNFHEHEIKNLNANQDT